MKMHSLDVRSISYASTTQNKHQRFLIKSLENISGRLHLLRRAQQNHKKFETCGSLWHALTEIYGLKLNCVDGALTNIPSSGPVILISNHPYGILDGLLLGHILNEVRGDFKIIAHKVFGQTSYLRDYIVPISFDETKEAVYANTRSRRDAIDYLASGGAIGIFPGGTVSTSEKLFSRPIDPIWRSFTAKMISKSDATVIPIYFHGHTSRLFQIASHLHYNLRMGLLMREFKSRIDGVVNVSIGDPISKKEIASRAANPKYLMDYLRACSYEFSPVQSDKFDLGYEFETQHKKKKITYSVC